MATTVHKVKKKTKTCETSRRVEVHTAQHNHWTWNTFRCLRWCVWAWVCVRRRSMHATHWVYRILFGSFFFILSLARRNDFMVWCTSSFNGIYFCYELPNHMHAPITDFSSLLYAPIRIARHPNTYIYQFHAMTIFWCVIACKMPRVSRTACGRTNFLDDDGHGFFHAAILICSHNFNWFDDWRLTLDRNEPQNDLHLLNCKLFKCWLSKKKIKKFKSDNWDFSTHFQSIDRQCGNNRK